MALAVEMHPAVVSLSKNGDDVLGLYRYGGASLFHKEAPNWSFALCGLKPFSQSCTALAESAALLEALHCHCDPFFMEGFEQVIEGSPLKR